MKASSGALGRRSVLLGGLGLGGVVLGGALLTGCNDNPSASEDAGFAAGDGSFTRFAPDQRVAAPVLTGEDLDGKKLSTADYPGKVLVLNVWGSWCAPCRKEAPALVEVAKQTASVAQVIGINTREAGVASAQAFVRAFSINFPSLYDPDGQLLLQLTALPPKTIPSTLLIDPSGKVAGRVLGAISAGTLATAIRDIADGK